MDFRPYVHCTGARRVIPAYPKTPHMCVNNNIHWMVHLFTSSSPQSIWLCKLRAISLGDHQRMAFAQDRRTLNSMTALLLLCRTSPYTICIFICIRMYLAPTNWIHLHSMCSPPTWISWLSLVKSVNLLIVSHFKCVSILTLNPPTTLRSSYLRIIFCPSSGRSLHDVMILFFFANSLPPKDQ